MKRGVRAVQTSNAFYKGAKEKNEARRARITILRQLRSFPLFCAGRDDLHGHPLVTPTLTSQSTNKVRRGLEEGRQQNRDKESVVS